MLKNIRNSCLGIYLTWDTATGKNKRDLPPTFQLPRECRYKTNNFLVFTYLYLTLSYSILYVWLDAMEMSHTLR